MTIELKLITSSPRIEQDEGGVVTLILGDGKTMFSPVATEDTNYTGVAFTDKPDMEPTYGVIEKGSLTPPIGTLTRDLGAHLQILANNPKSLQALIDILIISKEDLEERISNVN